MNQLVRLIIAQLAVSMLAVSAIGCWNQHRRPRASVIGESHLRPLVANSRSTTVEFNTDNVEHSSDSATSRNEINPKQLLDQPLLSCNFEKIEFGMKRGEVEKLLGGAPGHYGRNLGGSVMTCEAGAAGPGLQVWTDDTNMLEIAFDQNDSAVQIHKRAGYSRKP